MTEINEIPVQTSNSLGVSKSFYFSPNADLSNNGDMSPTSDKPSSMSKLAVKKKIQRSLSDPSSGAGERMTVVLQLLQQLWKHQGEN